MVLAASTALGDATVDRPGFAASKEQQTSFCRGRWDVSVSGMSGNTVALRFLVRVGERLEFYVGCHVHQIGSVVRLTPRLHAYE
jgi:hypothetical protein